MSCFFTVSRIALLIVLFAFIPSCNYESNSEINKKDYVNFNAKSNTTKVNIIGNWEKDTIRNKLIKDFLREYEFKNQHLEIAIDYPGNIISNYINNRNLVPFISDLALNNAPKWDIVPLKNQVGNICAFANDSAWAKNNLVDFSKIPEFIETTNPALLTTEEKKRWGGIIPGPFIEGSYWTLWVNKTVAEKIGIQVKNKGMSADDFLKYIEATNTYNFKNPENKIITILEAGDWQTSFVIAFQLFSSQLANKTDAFSEKITEEKLNAWYKTLQILEKMAQLNSHEKDWESQTFKELNTRFLAGEGLFYPNGSWMYSTWKSLNSKLTDNISPCELPSVSSTKAYPITMSIPWGVMKNSPNKDEAIELLLKINKQEFANNWVQNTKCPTGIKADILYGLFGADQYLDFIVYMNKQYSLKNRYDYQLSLYKYIFGSNNLKATYYKDVLNGRARADEAMRKIREFVNQ